jgi:environmental stress-induced protein Ves
MIKLLSPLAYRVLPWKNGGGSTTEIAVDPDGADWEAFNWRVTIADIRESGPFSSFPGIDRSILLLDTLPGARDPHTAAMDLVIDGRTIPMQPRTFIDFAGESATEGVLKGDPVRDFNVMSRRGVVRHRRGWHSTSPNEVHRMGGVDTRVIHLASGSAELIHGQTLRTMVAGESVIAWGDDTLQLKGGPGGAQLVWVVFSRVDA